MIAADYLVDFLIKHGVTDVFGLPGEVVLPVLHALDKRRDEIVPRLCCHEQGASLAAAGYAQSGGRIGAAYATKGPGFTNMLTGIADCYHNSLAALFITAHNTPRQTALRFMENQELDTVKLSSGITKYAARIETADEVCQKLTKAYNAMTSGRHGPALLDFAASAFQQEVFGNRDTVIETHQTEYAKYDSSETIARAFSSALIQAKRPILLIGDGIHQSGTETALRQFAEKLAIPVLSSRFSQDIIPNVPYYFGYIGSHGLRYSNFILSKCDAVLALGNRMAYNPASQSFSRFTRQAKIIRVDCDCAELKRPLRNAISFYADLKTLVPVLARSTWKSEKREWLDVCNELKQALFDCDIEYPVDTIAAIIKTAGNDAVITGDVGNNEVRLSRAYAFSGAPNRALYSNTFGALGCSVPKAIGMYYAARKRILCFTGDQGFLLNMQELHGITRGKLPITIVVLNNHASGMIRDRQTARGLPPVHTTQEGGYFPPDTEAIAKAFSVPFYAVTEETGDFSVLFNTNGPIIAEIQYDETPLPYLPKGRPCQDFDPPLERGLYNKLEKLEVL